MSPLAIVCVALAALWMLDALRMRRRVAALAVLPASDQPAAADHCFLVRPGVTLDEPTRRAASAFARARGLEVVDLVPHDLSCWRTLLLIQGVDPDRFRQDRFARGRTAGDAILVSAAVLARMEHPGEAPADPVAFAALAARLKQYACSEMDLAVAPSLRAGHQPFGARGRLLRQGFGDLVVPVVLGQIAFALAAPFLAGPIGLLPIAALHLQPVLATLGMALRPRDRALTLLLRALLDLASTLTTVRPVPRGGPEPVRARRPIYRELLAGGTDRFFEPRRADCPVCGSRSLARRLSIGDHYQFKPGRFTLDRCTDCGHLFQNPRLSIEGLGFYYRDFYDGLGEEALDRMFGFQAKPYLARARLLDGAGTPSRWLDVGAGHGHFCCAAREVWPGVRFDGLDFSDSIEDAVRRRWVDHGYRGLFPEIAPRITGQYDVVSMSHYLEHTREPAAEIAAASQVLSEGGFLLIEVPDPDSRMARLLGSFWMPWFQPQHQHFLTTGNLERLLRAHAFEPLVWHRGEAHQPVDLLFFSYTILHQIARPIDAPWRPPTGLPARLWHRLVWSAGIPVLALSWMFDRLTAPLFRRPGWSNTYRVLARLSAQPQGGIK